MTTVTIFYGSPVAKFVLLGTTVQIGYIPIGTGVGFDVPSFDRKFLPVRLAVILSAPIALLILAGLFLGFAPAVQQFMSGFAQLTSGALHPRTTALNFIERLHAVSSHSVPAACGVVAAKLTVCSLFSVAALAAGSCFKQLFSISDEHGAISLLHAAGFVTVTLLTILWTIALLRYGLSGNA